VTTFPEPEETAVARQWLSKHFSLAVDMHTHTIEELLEAVFSVGAPEAI
jgi:hypothetical protein